MAVFGLFVSGCLNKQSLGPTVSMELDKQFWVRVLLFDNLKECTLRINGPFEITSAETVQGYHFARNKKPIGLKVRDGRLSIGEKTFASKHLIIKPKKTHTFIINGQKFRGNLRIVLNSRAESFTAINHLPMDGYLNGVISAEMPYYWEQQALRAQAIAARSYCWYIKNTFGPKRQWDVKRTQASQVYKGLVAETARTREAVWETRGRILLCKGPDGIAIPFAAYYSSTCGGHTENSKNVFGDSVGPLGGVECPYCRDAVRASILFWPTAVFSRAEVDKRIFKKYPKLAELKKIDKITTTRQSNYGKLSRVTMVKLTGSDGKEGFLRGEDLRLTIDPTGSKIKSAACTIALIDNKWTFIGGRGFGHGVGMCQYGALAMARKGKSAEEIIEHYYPGSQTIQLY